MPDALSFFNGIPTAPDVQLIMDRWPEPQAGDTFPYKEIEDLIKESRKTSRFRTVTNAWKKRLEAERNLLVETISGQGFRVSNPSERVSFSAKKAKSGFRAIKRGSEVAAKTDRSKLNEEEKRTCDHLTKLAATISGIARTAAKQVEMPD